MRYLSNISALTTIIILLFAPFLSNPNVFQQNELAKAIQLFDKKQYEEAEKLFGKLIGEHPDDFMVNYFYGACRTENGHYSDQDLAYLVKASKEVSPLDIDYYFGMQYHAKEEWDKALMHYEIFGKTADQAELNRVKLDDKIEQCKNQVNPFNWISSDTKPEIIVSNNPANTNEKDTIIGGDMPELMVSEEDFPEMEQDSVMADELYVVETQEVVKYSSEPDEIKPEDVPIDFEDVPIDFSIRPEIRYKMLSNFKTQEGKELYESALVRQKELETVLNRAKKLRESYITERNRTVKDSIGQQILGLEDRSYELKSEINTLFSASKLSENEYWDNATEDERATFTATINAPETQKKPVTPNPDYTVPIEIPEILMDNTAFQSKPNESANKDLSYKIQIGAYSRGLPTSVKRLFDKLSLIRKIDQYTDDRGVVVYTTGNLSNLGDALTMLQQVQQEGAEDAIIAAYFKGKRIPLTEAKEIEGIK